MTRPEPIFNRPDLHPAPLILAAAIAAIHLYGTLLDAHNWFRISDHYVFSTGRFNAALQGRGHWIDLRTLWTHAFLHANWGHVAANGIGLVFLGDMCARAMGAGRFFTFYLLCAAAGALAFWGVATVMGAAASTPPMVGASGAVFGLLGAILRLRFGRMGPGRGQWLASVFFQLALANLLFDFALGGRLAWEAHLGGCVAGWLLAPWAMDPR